MFVLYFFYSVRFYFISFSLLITASALEIFLNLCHQLIQLFQLFVL